MSSGFHPLSSTEEAGVEKPHSVGFLLDRQTLQLMNTYTLRYFWLHWARTRSSNWMLCLQSTTNHATDSTYNSFQNSNLSSLKSYLGVNSKVRLFFFSISHEKISDETDGWGAQSTQRGATLTSRRSILGEADTIKVAGWRKLMKHNFLLLTIIRQEMHINICIRFILHR